MVRRGGHDTDAGTKADVDLVAVENAEADGDDITIEIRPDPPAPRRRTRLVVAAVALVAVASAAGAVVALNDDDRPASIETAATEARTATSIASRSDATQSAPPTTVAQGAVVDPPPLVPDPEAGGEGTPADVLESEPADPPAVESADPTVAPVAVLEATLEPPAATVPAGTDVAVTVRVRNTGGAPGTYTVDTDGCPPTLVTNPEQVCILIVQTVDVPPGGEATQMVMVGTTGASPGDYVVTIGDRELRVTIV